MRSRILLNDVHSRLNPTAVAEVVLPRCVEDVVQAVKRARRQGLTVSVGGALHAMGGQAFGERGLHLNMRGLNRLVALDNVRGLARVQAGITWAELLGALEAAQAGAEMLWTFRQKQTGADELTLGGAVAANIHGRGLDWKPFVEDVESLTLVDAEGTAHTLSRTQNVDWFRLVIGGYGLFGVVVELELRLQPRRVLQRVVEITRLEGLVDRVAGRVAAGFELGDFQFCPDAASPHFLREGVFACYRPVAAPGGPSAPAALNPEAWTRLLTLAHSDMPRGWAEYTAHYRRSDGQTYWSDHAQLSHYDPRYEERLRVALPTLQPGSLMISELYVPPARLEDFMAAAARELRRLGARVIYGTVRFIRRDDETFLPWARQDYACVVVNLRVTHTPAGLAAAQQAFRTLIDLALEREGSYYLTYHRWATAAQVERAYPRLGDFLRFKEVYDPRGVFQSEWYRHMRQLWPRPL